MNRAATALRATAIGIAVAGLIDPVFPSTRVGRPIVRVVAGPTSADRALGDRVARALSRDAIVTREGAVADATVMAGRALDDVAPVAAGPVFTVSGSSPIGISSLDAPRTAASGSRVTVRLRAERFGSGARQYVLRADGVAVDSTSRSDAASGESIALQFVPTTVGPVRLRVTATAGNAEPAHADALVDVHESRWPVLVYDARPSWASTFARRALEQDARFVVASRAITSRAIARDAGAVPSQFDDPSLLAAFDAVLIGAPDALTERDVSALERYVHDRGGRVVLLLDAVGAGPWQRLAGGAPWRVDSTGASAVVRARTEAADSVHAREIAWPTELSAATVLATAVRARDTEPRPVIVRRAAGLGAVVTSGVLDAWRARDRDGTSADRFWLALVAAEAAQRTAPLTISLERSLVEPHERLALHVALGQGAAVGRSIGVAATIISDSGATAGAVRLWPALAPGGFTAEVDAPASPGRYRISVRGEGLSASVPFIVDSTVHRAAADDRALLAALATAHGGDSRPEPALPQLGSAIAAAVRPAAEPTPVAPMRAPWWILPFALALCGEWWIRRRAGHP